jgi:hypothetical protein
LLFVLGANLLQSIVNAEALLGNLSHPLGPNFGGSFPIIQYVDDTLVVLPTVPSQIGHLKNVLEDFAYSTGLKVNFGKSFSVSINVEESKWPSLTNALGCQLGTLPFTYLGLPLGTTRPSVQDLSPILTRLEKRLMGISRHLTYAGRLILVNFVFSALPTFYMCSLKLPMELLEQIDKYKKHVLWHGVDVTKKGGYLVAWKRVCRSKEEGGLGIINLKNHNSALLMMCLHKFYNRLDLP